MATVINCFDILGIDAYVVNIEVDTIFGQPSVSIVGLGDASVKESKERLEAAINFLEDSNQYNNIEVSRDNSLSRNFRSPHHNASMNSF